MIAGVPIAGVAPRRAAVRLRPVTLQDRGRIWRWNTDPSVRSRSLDPQPIAAETHLRWFAARMADRLTRMSIILADDEPVGLVRLERTAADQPARISIVVEGAARGRGIGRAAIELACHADGGPVVAEILHDNRRSLASFLAAGFQVCATTPASSHLLWSSR